MSIALRRFSIIVAIGKLAIAAGWYSGEMPALCDITILSFWPTSGITILDIKVIQAGFSILWDMVAV